MERQRSGSISAQEFMVFMRRLEVPSPGTIARPDRNSLCFVSFGEVPPYKHEVQVWPGWLGVGFLRLPRAHVGERA